MLEILYRNDKANRYDWTHFQKRLMKQMTTEKMVVILYDANAKTFERVSDADEFAQIIAAEPVFLYCNDGLLQFNLGNGKSLFMQKLTNEGEEWLNNNTISDIGECYKFFGNTKLSQPVLSLVFLDFSWF